MKHKIAGCTYRSTDLTQWLALDVAAQALADARIATWVTTVNDLPDPVVFAVPAGEEY
jgi:hypothetical protein